MNKSFKKMGTVLSMLTLSIVLSAVMSMNSATRQPVTPVAESDPEPSQEDSALVVLDETPDENPVPKHPRYHPDLETQDTANHPIFHPDSEMQATELSPLQTQETHYDKCKSSNGWFQSNFIVTYPDETRDWNESTVECQALYSKFYQNVIPYLQKWELSPDGKTLTVYMDYYAQNKQSNQVEHGNTEFMIAV